MDSACKRFLALLMAFVMVLTLLPVSTRAEECTHENWGHKSAGSSEWFIIDSDYHGKTYYSSRVCVDCGAVIMERDPSQTYTKKYYHSYFYLDPTVCEVCKYRPGSTHTHSYSTSPTETKVEQVDSTYHNVVTTTNTVCSCGAAGEPTVTTVQEAHTLDSSRKCTGCGYQVPCTHENTSYEMETQSYERVDGQFHAMYYRSYQKCQDCGKILENYGTSSTQEYHKKVPESTTTSLVKVDDTYHNVVTTTRMRCACGYSTNSSSKVQEAHTVQGYSYDTGHPHQKYGTCECGAKIYVEGQFQTANGAQQDADKCCLCHGHKFGAAQEAADGTWKKTCANCGLTQSAQNPSHPTEPEETKPQETVPPEIHVHSYVYGTAAAAHPHNATGVCACGAIDTVPESFFSCCQCQGSHIWGDVVRLPDDSFRMVCTRCNASQTVTPSGDVLLYYRVVDTITYRHNAAKVYQNSHQIDSSASAIWKTIAEQATDKLLDTEFVTTNETLEAINRGAVFSLKDVLTEETWDEQQKEYWKDLLTKMLQSHYDTDELESGAAATEFVFNIFAGKEKLFEKVNADEVERLEMQLGTLDEKLNVLEGKLNEFLLSDSLPVDGDMSHHSAFARSNLEELKETLTEYKENTKDQKFGNEHYYDLTSGFGLYFKVIEIFVDCVEEPLLMGQYNKTIEELGQNVENQKILESISKTAKETGNKNLQAAADEMILEIQDSMLRAMNLLTSMGESLVDFILEAGFEIGKEYFKERVEGALETVFKECSHYLDILSLGGFAMNLYLDWDEAYEEGQKLMTLNQMDATMNIVQVLKEEDNPYMAELWGVLQTEGCDQAKVFLKQWSQGRDLSETDFGIKEGTLSSVNQQLDIERKFHIDMLGLSIEE